MDGKEMYLLPYPTHGFQPGQLGVDGVTLADVYHAAAGQRAPQLQVLPAVEFAQLGEVSQPPLLHLLRREKRL